MKNREEDDPLVKKVDKHLAKVRLEEFLDTLHYRMGYLMPPPPLWLFLGLVLFFGGLFYLFFYTDHVMNFIEYLARLYIENE